MHFYEASIITTKDGLHCQVYSNEHPLHSIIVKPKYIPTDKIESDALPYRFISGKKMNRLDMWIKDSTKLKTYFEAFSKAYPHYIFDAERYTFSVPIDYIEKVYFPRTGFSELMKMKKEHLDEHLKTVRELGGFLLGSELTIKDFGITYSSLTGHYLTGTSDINYVVYGKKNYWTLMKYLETATHPSLRWKTSKEWLTYRTKRNRSAICTKEEFLHSMTRKHSEGYFNDSLFLIFCAEKEEELWQHWGTETITPRGHITIRATVTDDQDSVTRPGRYLIKDATIVNNPHSTPQNPLTTIHHPSSTTHNPPLITSVVFHSRDYCMIAQRGETIEVSGQLEETKNKKGTITQRVVVGYFSSYLNERREQEYIKTLIDEKKELTTPSSKKESTKKEKNDCELCNESILSIGTTTPYGASIIYKIGAETGAGKNGWFATLSPKTGGDPLKDFTIQLMPTTHVRHFADMSVNTESSKNYGIAFARISTAIKKIMDEEHRNKENDENISRVGVYGKSKHPEEHLHIKLFPWTGTIGQPYTVDSSYEKKEVFNDKKTGNEYITMRPVKKTRLTKERHSHLAKRFLELLR